MTVMLTPLLPHLDGLTGVAPAPWRFGPWEERQRLLEELPPRVWPLLLCEYARSVLPVWERWSATDRRPHRSIAARTRWCLDPTPARLSAAAYAAYAADAADAADAACAACAAYAACAAGEAGAADAAQWYWMYLAYLGACGDWNPEWTTSTVHALAWYAWRRRDWSVMPVLADALDDAGCDDAGLLTRLREPGVFTRADVAITGPLGIRGSVPAAARPQE